MRTRYVEILAKESAVQAAKERDFGKIELKEDNTVLRIPHVKISDKRIVSKIEELSEEEKTYWDKIFDIEFTEILKKGTLKIKNKERIQAGIGQKWE